MEVSIIPQRMLLRSPNRGACVALRTLHNTSTLCSVHLARGSVMMVMRQAHWAQPPATTITCVATANNNPCHLGIYTLRVQPAALLIARTVRAAASSSTPHVARGTFDSTRPQVLTSTVFLGTCVGLHWEAPDEELWC
jgi:hypothetical protein